MDKATMKWWVDYANRLERELSELREELGHYQIELHRQQEISDNREETIRDLAIQMERLMGVVYGNR
jgi:hypothetical protein